MNKRLMGAAVAAGCVLAGPASAGPTGEIRVLAVEGEPVLGLPGWTFDELSNLFQAGPVVTDESGVWFHARLRETATDETAEALFRGYPFGGAMSVPPPQLMVLEGDAVYPAPSDWVLRDMFNPIVGAGRDVLFQGRYGPGEAMPGPTNAEDDVTLVHNGSRAYEAWHEGDPVSVPFFGPAIADGFAWPQANRRGDYSVASVAESSIAPGEFASGIWATNRTSVAPTPVVWDGDEAPWLGDDAMPLAVETVNPVQSRLTDDYDVAVVARLAGAGVTDDNDVGLWLRRVYSSGERDDWASAREGDAVPLPGGETGTLRQIAGIPMDWEGTSQVIFAGEVLDDMGQPTAALYRAFRDEPLQLTLAIGDDVEGLGPVTRIPGVGGPAGGQPVGAGIDEGGNYAFVSRFGSGADERVAVVHANHPDRFFQGVAAIGAWVPGQDDSAEFVHLGNEIAHENGWTAFLGHYTVDTEGQAFRRALFVRDLHGNVAQVLAQGDQIQLGEGDSATVQTFLLWDGARGRALNQFGWLGVGVQFEDSRSAMLAIILQPGSPCGPVDLNQDGVADFLDVYEFLVRFAAGSPSVDQTFDRLLDFDDALLFLDKFVRGPC